jgi:nitroreductase
MDVKKAIEKRKSIRRFKEKEVPEKIIREIIDAARLAPSAHNLQLWNFVIVRDKKTKLKFKENNVFVQKEMYSAPVVIVCCTDKSAYSKHSIKNLENSMNLVNLSLSSAFLVLRATELGLGTCFIAWCDKEKIKKVLEIPKQLIIPYVIVMGYPAEKPAPRSRKKLNEVIHFEKW